MLERFGVRSKPLEYRDDPDLAEIVERLELRSNHVLLYLADQVAMQGTPLTRSDVEKLANEMQKDATAETPRTLGEISQSLGIGGESIPSDSLLSHVVLQYDPEEMATVEEEFVQPWKKGTIPRSPVDWKAGYGAARPLLLDMHRLALVGALVIREQTSTTEESFLPTNKGAGGLARSLNITFELRDIHPDTRIIVGRDTASMQSASVQV